MPRAAVWKKEENLCLAKAWITASEEGSAVKGTGQRIDNFWHKVVALITLDAPRDAVVRGTYHARTRTALKNHWRDDVAKDVNNFNKCLKMIQTSYPTGCSIQERINMAVAIKMAKTSVRDYRYKQFDPNDWVNYATWKVLRRHRKFLPPKPMTRPPPPPPVACSPPGVVWAS